MGIFASSEDPMNCIFSSGLVLFAKIQTYLRTELDNIGNSYIIPTSDPIRPDFFY